MHKTAPTTKIFQPQRSIVPRLGKPALDRGVRCVPVHESQKEVRCSSRVPMKGVPVIRVIPTIQ